MAELAPPVEAAGGRSGAAAAHGPTVVALVHNGFTHDSRVRNEAAALAAAGRRVVVVATLEKGLAPTEAGEGFGVVRVGFDPPDVRFWRLRDRAARPYRHTRTYGAWVRRSFRGRMALVRGPVALLAGVLVAPWVALTWVWHQGMRVLNRVTPGRRLGARLGRRIEDRALRVVLSAHRPLRLRDWGDRVADAVRAGTIPAADAWHANDLETLPAALGLAAAFGGVVVYDSHEVFLEAAGRARLAPWRRWLLRRLEARWIRRASAVVTVNDAVAAELARRYRITPPVVLRNCAPAWAAPDGFRSPLLDAVAAQVDDPSLPVVLAHGTFQLHRGYEQLLAAAEGIPGLNVAFLGYGGQEEAYRAIAATPPWRGRLAILPAVPSQELSPWVAGASVVACLIQPSTLNHRLSTPNKLFEAIAAGVPVLASDLPAIASIVRSSGAGVLVDPTDTAAIRAALAALVADPARRATLAAAAREAARTELNWAQESRKLVALYDALAGAAR